MGGSESKTSQLNKAITDVTTEVVAKMSSNASGSIVSKQEIVFAGTGSNIDILQQSRINLNVLQKSNVNASMQAEIMSKIMAVLNKERAGMPEITRVKSDTQIASIVENNVSNSFSQESLSNISISIEMDQSISFLKGSAYEAVKLEQTAEGVGKLINNMAGSIVQELTSGTDLESKSTEISKNPIADIVTSVGDGMSKFVNSVGAQFGFSQEMIWLFILVVILGFLGTYFTFGSQPPTQNYSPPYTTTR
jgi:hypothetical protein